MAVVVLAGAAVLLGYRHAHDAGLAQLAEEPPGQFARLLPAGVAGNDLPFDELADHEPNASCSGVKMSRRIVPLPHQLDERGVGRAASLAHRLQPQA